MTFKHFGGSRWLPSAILMIFQGFSDFGNFWDLPAATVDTLSEFGLRFAVLSGVRFFDLL